MEEAQEALREHGVQALQNGGGTKYQSATQLLQLCKKGSTQLQSVERLTREERAQTLAVDHTVDGGSRSEPFDPHDGAHGQSFEEVAPQHARADGSAMQERV